MELLTRYDDHTSIVDTLAVGYPRVVAAYLIHGKESALVDMGYASSFDIVSKDIASSEVGSGIDYLLPTHVHLDHSGSCGALADSFPSASIRVHPVGERHLVDPSRLWEGARELFGDELMQLYGKPAPISIGRVSAIADDEVITLGSGLSLRAIWTPGHASHHLSYVLEGTGRVFTGDLVGITYPDFPRLIPTTPPTSFDLESAVESLKRIRELSPGTLFTPHFGIIERAEDSLESNIQALISWVTKIDGMLKSGQSLASLTGRITREIAGERGCSVGSMPGYVQVSIKISVLGVVRYLARRGKLDAAIHSV